MNRPTLSPLRDVAAPADQVTGREFFEALFGPSPRDRELEAQYLRFINEHWQAAKAKSDAMVKRGDESALAFTIRRLGPIYAHEAWEREQRALWLRGAWEAPVPFTRMSIDLREDGGSLAA